MSKFTFTANVDEACARLKATLDAQDAAFNASLAAAFKAPPPRAPINSAFAPPAAGGLSLTTSRKRTWR